VLALGLEPGRFVTVIARPEPENSLYEVVKAFSSRKRGYQLAVLGQYLDTNAYHRTVKAAASDEVCFLGAIYDAHIVQALRYHSAAYVHGHQVGGTNPSLVEALGAGNPVIAHDNRFNRWVAGEGACYFDSVESLCERFDEVMGNTEIIDAMRDASSRRFRRALTWPIVLSAYEKVLNRFSPDPEAHGG